MGPVSEGFRPRRLTFARNEDDRGVEGVLGAASDHVESAALVWTLILLTLTDLEILGRGTPVGGSAISGADTANEEDEPISIKLSMSVASVLGTVDSLGVVVGRRRIVLIVSLWERGKIFF